MNQQKKHLVDTVLNKVSERLLSDKMSNAERGFMGALFAFSHVVSGLGVFLISLIVLLSGISSFFDTYREPIFFYWLMSKTQEWFTLWGQLVIAGVFFACTALSSKLKKRERIRQEECPRDDVVNMIERARTGDANSFSELAHRVASGVWFVRDEKLCVALNVVAAELGNSDAAMQVSRAYEKGMGVPVSAKMANAWLIRSCEIDAGVQDKPGESVPYEPIDVDGLLTSLIR